MTFTSADHVTQREEGPWRDCTWASMLETLRQGLPDGRSIPSAQAEVERFRAAGGYPDNHPGVTIEKTLPAARSRYGLHDDQYRLTRDWSVAEDWLRDPTKVFVVTGSMGHIPANLRRWSPSFFGAHAVAGRGATVPTWCDPLAPKGTYHGEPVTLATWRSFATSLPGWQVLSMEAWNAPVKVTDPTPKLVNLPSGRQLYEVDGATPLVKVVPATVDTYSPAGGPSATQRYVVITTGGVRQQAVVMVAGLTFRPFAGGDEKRRVTLQVEGQPDYSTTV